MGNVTATDNARYTYSTRTLDVYEKCANIQSDIAERQRVIHIETDPRRKRVLLTIIGDLYDELNETYAQLDLYVR